MSEVAARIFKTTEGEIKQGIRCYDLLPQSVTDTRFYDTDTEHVIRTLTECLWKQTMEECCNDLKINNPDEEDDLACFMGEIYFWEESIYFTILDEAGVDLQVNYIENNTWARGKMKFIIECSTRGIYIPREIPLNEEQEDQLPKRIWKDFLDGCRFANGSLDKLFSMHFFHILFHADDIGNSNFRGKDLSKVKITDSTCEKAVAIKYGRWMLQVMVS